MNTKIQKIKTRGYTLIELLFYISLFFILTITIINSLITMTRAFREVAIYTDFIQSSMIMDRISREIRQSYEISSISATSLKLNAKDESDAEKTVEFTLFDYNMRLFENDVFVGNLNAINIQVTDLLFTNVTTSIGQAVRVSLSVKNTKDPTGRVEDFYETVVLRGSY